MNNDFLELAKPVKLVIFDVDGVLTDGRVFLNESDELKGFSTYDGLGIKLLQSTGISTAIITGRKSKFAQRRFQNLGIKHVYEGVDNKVKIYHELKQILDLNDEQIAYVGDDLPDLPVMLQAGFAIAVANAHPLVIENSQFQTKKQGGYGAAREACEAIMRAQGTLDEMYERFLT